MSYITQRGRALVDYTNNFADRQLTRKRSDGRLKRFESCSDCRAWNIQDRVRSLHLLEMVNTIRHDPEQLPVKYNYSGNIVALILCTKDTEIRKLKHKVKEKESFCSDAQIKLDNFQGIIVENIHLRKQLKSSEAKLSKMRMQSEQISQTVMVVSHQIENLEDFILRTQSPQEELQICYKIIDIFKNNHFGLTLIQEENKSLREQLDACENAQNQTVANMTNGEANTTDVDGLKIIIAELRYTINTLQSIKVHRDCLRIEVNRLNKRMHEVAEHYNGQFSNLCRRSQIFYDVINERNMLQKEVDKYSGLDDRVKDLLPIDKEREALKNERDELLIRLECSESARKQLDSDMAVMRSVNEQQLTIRFSSCEKIEIELDKLRLQVDQFEIVKKERDKLEEQLEALNCVKSEFTVFQKKYEELCSIENSMAGQIVCDRNIHEECKSLNKQLHHAKNTILQKDDEIKNLVLHIEQLTNDQDLKTNELRTIQSELNDTSTQLNRCKEELSGMVSLTDDMQNIQRELEETIQTVMTEKQILLNQLDDTKVSLNASSTEVAMIINLFKDFFIERMEPIDDVNTTERVVLKLFEYQNTNAKLKKEIEHITSVCYPVIPIPIIKQTYCTSQAAIKDKLASSTVNVLTADNSKRVEACSKDSTQINTPNNKHALVDLKDKSIIPNASVVSPKENSNSELECTTLLLNQDKQHYRNKFENTTTVCHSRNKNINQQHETIKSLSHIKTDHCPAQNKLPTTEANRLSSIKIGNCKMCLKKPHHEEEYIIENNYHSVSSTVLPNTSPSIGHLQQMHSEMDRLMAELNNNNKVESGLLSQPDQLVSLSVSHTYERKLRKSTSDHSIKFNGICTDLNSLVKTYNTPFETANKIDDLETKYLLLQLNLKHHIMSIDVLQSKLLKLKAENNKYKLNLNQCETDLKTSQSQHNQIEAEHNLLTDENKYLKEHINQLQSTANQNISKEDKEEESVANENRELHKDLTVVRNQLNILQTQNESLQTEMATITAEKDKAFIELASLGEQINEAQKELFISKAQTDNACNELKSSTNKCKELKCLNDQFLNNIQTLTEEVASISEQNNELKREVHELNARLDSKIKIKSIELKHSQESVQNEIRNLKTENCSSKEEIKMLKETLFNISRPANTAAIIEKGQQQKATCQILVNELKSDIYELSNKLNALHSPPTSSSYTPEIIKLVSDLESAYKTIADLKSKARQLKDETSSKNETKREFSDQLTKIQAALASEINNSSEKSQMIISLTTKTDDLRTEVKGLKDERNQLKRKITDLKKDNCSLQEQVKTVLTKINKCLNSPSSINFPVTIPPSHVVCNTHNYSKPSIEDHKVLLEALKKQHDMEITGVENECQARLQAICDKYDNEFATKDKQYDLNMKSLKDAYDRDVKRVKQEHYEGIQRMQSFHDEIIKEQLTLFKAEVHNMQTEKEKLKCDVRYTQQLVHDLELKNKHLQDFIIKSNFPEVSKTQKVVSEPQRDTCIICSHSLSSEEIQRSGTFSVLQRLLHKILQEGMEALDFQELKFLHTCTCYASTRLTSSQPDGDNILVALEKDMHEEEETMIDTLHYAQTLEKDNTQCLKLLDKEQTDYNVNCRSKNSSNDQLFAVKRFKLFITCKNFTNGAQ